MSRRIAFVVLPCFSALHTLKRSVTNSINHRRYSSIVHAVLRARLPTFLNYWTAECPIAFLPASSCVRAPSVNQCIWRCHRLQSDVSSANERVERSRKCILYTLSTSHCRTLPENKKKRKEREENVSTSVIGGALFVAGPLAASNHSLSVFIQFFLFLNPRFIRR